VQPKLTSALVEEYRQQLEDEMNDMYTRLWQEYGRLRHAEGAGR
jgi:hypothetical protein